MTSEVARTGLLERPEIRRAHVKPCPVRILELRCADGTGGGPEKTILHGAASADERFSVTVCYLCNHGDAAFDIHTRAARLGLDYVEIRQRGAFDLTVLSAVRRVVRERGIDLVHAHDYKTDLLTLLLARLEGTIPLATAHGWTGHSRRERWFYYPADKRLLARYPHVVAVSSEIRTELLRHGAEPERVSVILNGIDPHAYRRDGARVSAARAKLGLQPDEIVVGAVGRLTPQKRFDVLLQALAPLHTRRPKLRLLIAGAGELHDALAAEARRLRLGDACRFLGHVSDVAGFHHAVDVLVQSSDYEGTPNVVLEAMALETPVIATEVGGTAELVANGVHGLIVRPRDPQALAAALEQTLGDRHATAARVRAARRRVENELSFAARTRAVEAIYDDLLAR